MSQLTKIIDNMVPSSTVELEPYNFRINNEDLSFNSHKSICEIDTDGELMLDFHIEKDTLLDIIDEDDIITYLENRGYTVEESK